MSAWTYVKGVLTVSPYGRTQAEIRYVLDTVLAHLPKISGSEHDVNIYVIQPEGHNHSSSHDEFEQPHPDNGWFEKQDDYLVVLDGNLRDRYFEETLQEFMKWLMRLASRCWVQECFVKVSGHRESNYEYAEQIIKGDFYEYRTPWSWEGKGVVNWCEYLLWKAPHDSKGRLYGGKPDFPDGRCLDLMTDKERQRFWDEIAAKKKKKRHK